jgi:lipopolysaccharide transport system permease protein
MISDDLPVPHMMQSKQRTGLAVADMVNGARLWRLWLLLGWLDIRQRYRRAMIGPFWITISMAIMIVTLGILYSSLFKIDIADFIPFLAAGFAIWFLISSTVSDGAVVFVQAETIIRNTGLPISIHIYRLACRNIITFCHNIVVMLGVYLYFTLNPGVAILLLVPGLIILLMNLLAMAMILGIICVRFRDAPPIIANLMQIAFFVTPILYRRDLIAGDTARVFADWNPFYYMIDVLRSPLLGYPPPMATFLILALITCANLTIAFLLFRRFRARIAYWL